VSPERPHLGTHCLVAGGEADARRLAGGGVVPLLHGRLLAAQLHRRLVGVHIHPQPQHSSRTTAIWGKKVKLTTIDLDINYILSCLK